ncbi:MAG: serine/threonine-protein kinase [Candidatus ainarchaeum sp.]|nr:serine/threonine-protein kinase [Candidatus ainarchaeum sp.]
MRSPGSPLVDAQDPFKGRVITSDIAQYRILDKIGAGGMGVVYKAEKISPPSNDSIVAVKFLGQDAATAGPDTMERFRREAYVLSKLKHPHIVELRDFGKDSHMFLVMEYLDGRSLAAELPDLTKGEPKNPKLLAWDRIKSILLQTCDGLSAAHSKNIYHRDIKPENIVLIKHNEMADWVKLLDFGTAKDTSNVTLTQTGMVVGTLLYLPPEAFMFPEEFAELFGDVSKDRLNIAREVYSTGAVLYQLLTGTTPFYATSNAVLARQVLTEPVIPPSQRAPFRGIPRDLDRFFVDALAKGPLERFHSIDAFRYALNSIEWDGLRRRTFSGFRAKRKLGFLTKIVLGAALVIGAGWVITNPDRVRSFFTNAQHDTYSFYNDHIRPSFLKHNFNVPKAQLPERKYSVSITSNVDSARVYLNVAGKREYVGMTPLTYPLSGEITRTFTVKHNKQVQQVSVSPNKTAVTVHFAAPHPQKPKRQPEPEDTEDSIEVGSE